MFNSATFNYIQFNSVGSFASSMIVNIVMSRPITLNAYGNSAVLNAVSTGLMLSSTSGNATLTNINSSVSLSTTGDKAIL